MVLMDTLIIYLEFGSCGDITLPIIEKAVEMSKENMKLWEFFFNNFFTNNDLMKHLSEREIMVAGTQGGGEKCGVREEYQKNRSRFIQMNLCKMLYNKGRVALTQMFVD